MQPFVLARELERRYGDYIRTAFPFADPALRKIIDLKIREEHLLASGPIVSLQRAFEPGPTIAEFESSGLIHTDVAKIFSRLEPYGHQAEALLRLSDRDGKARSTIVTTGTGSGKTEAFLLPIFDYCMRHPGDGVKALIVYPMNALANDQLNRLRGYLRRTGITFGRYTGDTREYDGDGRPDEAPPEECWSRDSIRKRHPNILITSYRMLEYLLVRRQDQAIFRPGGAPASLRYLVLDEVHTYDGALGTEIACLIRRLRGHLNLKGPSLVCVGTSATVGQDQADAVCRFASELFAVDIDRSGLIEERYAEGPPHPERLEPPPVLSDAELASIEDLGERSGDEDVDLSPSLLSALSKIAGKSNWPANWTQFQHELFTALHDRPLVHWLQHALRSPKRLVEVVNESLAVAGREAADVGDAEREIAAILTLGTVARNDDGALLRPRLHAFFRGLARTTRCLWCGELQANGDQVCTACHGTALPLEICRVCGQDFARAAVQNGDVALSQGTLTRIESEDETRQTGANVIRFAREYQKVVVEEEEDGDDDSPDQKPQPPPPHRVAYCVDCGFLRDPDEGADIAGHSPCVNCGKHRVAAPIFAGRGQISACPNCHGRYGSLEPITGLRSSTAVGTSILTWILMGRLKEEERRLLIFADSRQDTAYQAGYLADITAEYAWRQVAYRMVKERSDKDDVPYDFNGFWTKLYQFGLERYSIFSRDDREQQLNDLRWFLIKEFGRESRRRSALEYLGLVSCEYRGIEEIERHQDAFDTFRRAARANPKRPAFTVQQYRELLTGALDIVRRSGAISDEYALKFWAQNEPLRGLDDFNRRPVVFRRIGGGKSSYVNLRPIAGTSARRTAIEEFFARAGVEDPRAAAIAAADLLLEAALLAKVKAGGPQSYQREEGLALNVGRVSFIRPTQLLQCQNCRGISVRSLLGLCASPHCPNWEAPSLRPFDKASEDDNFYAAMYASFDPIRIDAREHSGQISGDRRMQYEEGFREGKINVLVASPTLELGVDIGALSTVLLRGLPPSPANYAQRAGRAGRRERIALVNAYAQASPHDTYFFRFPERMVSGTIDVPSFDLDNQEIVRRHIRALALEKLTTPLPSYMRDFLDIRDVQDPSPAQVVGSKIIGAGESMAELAAKRESIIAAVAEVFGADKREWLSAAYVREVLENFEADLARVIDRWHREVIELAQEIGRINDIANPNSEEKRRRQQYERTLDALTRRSGSPSGGGSDSYTLGYLSSHGFLPSYAFPGEAATLFAPEIDGGEVMREPSVALGEFAPENIVYVDGRKILCDGVFVQRHGAIPAGGDPGSYFHCDACGYIASRAWVGSCPRCSAVGTQSAQARIEPSAYRGRLFERIGAGEDSRQRRMYDVRGRLLDRPQFIERFEYEACAATLLRRQPLININEGRLIDGVAQAFEICTECGLVRPNAAKGDWIAQHRKRRNHEPKLQAVHLTNTLNSDVVVIEPSGLTDNACLTLRYALLAAAAVHFDATDREIDGFEEQSPQSGHWSTLLYERVSGGVGYVRRIPAALPILAGTALEIIRHENPCVKACYLCLLNYYNQRNHERIDKALVVDFLEGLAHETPAQGRVITEGVAVGADSGAQTDWELRLLRALEQRGLLGAVPQFEVVEPTTHKVVTIPDLAYPSQRIAIYVDGDAHHTSDADRAHDDRVRTRAGQLGWRIVAFPNSRIMSDLDGCVADVERLIEQV